MQVVTWNTNSNTKCNTNSYSHCKFNSSPRYYY